MRSVFLILYGVILLAGISDARLVNGWPYDKLVQASDLVAILQPISNENLANGTATSKADLYAVSTKFKVLSCLKGSENTGKTIAVIHFLARKGKMLSGMETIDFIVGPFNAKEKFEIGGHYADGWTAYSYSPTWIAFLKRSSDGSYSPVTGSIDPQLSFFEILSEFHSAIRGAGLE